MRFLTLLALGAMLLPLAPGMAAETSLDARVDDPAHDVSASEIPVDSIDLVSVRSRWEAGGETRVDFSAVNLSRQGYEDFVLARDTATGRSCRALVSTTDGMVEVGATLFTAAPGAKGSYDPFVWADLDWPNQTVIPLRVAASLDAATSAVHLLVLTPIPEAAVGYAESHEFGCAGTSRCWTSYRDPAEAEDDTFAGIVMPVGFSDLLPADDGSLTGPLRPVAEPFA